MITAKRDSDEATGRAVRFWMPAQGKKNFVLKVRARSGATRPPIQLVSGVFPGGGGGVKRQMCNVDRSNASRAEVKNKWSYTSNFLNTTSCHK
jgi:hypothetical protein